MAEEFDTPCWFVLRDLKRPNAKAPAYKVLPELGFETFTPMHWVLKGKTTGSTTREYVPFIHGLLFVKSLKSELDPIIEKTETLQYTYIKGARKTPMVVPTDDMSRFVKAVTALHSSCIYYSPADITPEMIGKKVKIVGGVMDGAVGHLLKQRGSKNKRLVVQLKGLLTASVEIADGYIQLV